MAVVKPNISKLYAIDWQIERWGRGKAAASPEYIVVHFTGTGGNGGTAPAVYANWLKLAEKARPNAHYIVDATGTYECVDPHRYACQYACSARRATSHIKFYRDANGEESPLACSHLKLAGNYNTINIETCSAKRTPVRQAPDAYVDTDFYFPDSTYRNLVALTSWLMEEFGIPAANVIMHHQISGKLCPAMWCNNKDAFSQWDAFKNDVLTVVNKPIMVSDLAAPTGQGTESDTLKTGKVSVHPGDPLYMSPGGVVVGYAQEEKQMDYKFERDGWYYTNDGYVKGNA